MEINGLNRIKEQLGDASKRLASAKEEVSHLAEDSRMESCCNKLGYTPTRQQVGSFVTAMALMACTWSAAPAFAGGADCVVQDNGTGTVTLPPEGCAYLSPDEFHMIVDGLPAGTEIILEPIHRDFLCKQGGLPLENCENPGGNLGGSIELFDSTIEFQATGTGALAGFNRVITLNNTFCEANTGPRNLGDAVQTFPNEMVQLQGSLFGDPDFDQLLVTAGTSNGLPSSGSTTLTRLGPPGSDFQVDSFFDITYRIDFQGAAGGALDGMAGSTTGTIRVEAFGTPSVCPLAPGPAWCANFQGTDCIDGLANDLCQPISVLIPPGGGIHITACDCLEPGGECGAVSITPDGELFRCPGDCPSGECQIYIDGVATGMPDFPASAVGPDSIVTCDCPPGDDCEPNSTGTGCTNTVCPDPTAEQCQPKCANFDPVTGIASIIACACDSFDTCHVNVPVPAGQPFCDGNCPPGTACEETLTTQADGTIDVCCDCVPEGEEACCLPDGTCVTIPASECLSSNGSPGGAGSVCSGIVGTCCFDADGDGIDESCEVLDEFCCSQRNGTFTIGGLCQGDANMNGIDDACETSDFCPLPTQPIIPICQQNLTQCVNGDPDQRCLPRLLINDPNLGVFPELCECFDFDGECGPITVRDLPGTPFLELSCENDCPPGSNCVIHIDGTATTTQSIPSNQVPFGSSVTCDCIDDGGEACCLPDGSCTVISVVDCVNLQGSPQGPGAVCGGALEACCAVDADGNFNCFDADPLCCVNEFNGTPGGPGSACDDSIGSCCYDADGDGIDESCGEMNQTCCTVLNGTFTGGGNCLGDSDNNGIDDACETSDFCPLPTGAIVPICQQNLTQCQDGDATQRCLPRLLIALANNVVFPELCECFDNDGECGPITVQDIPGTPFFDLSCENQCPTGQNCVVHIDGNSTNSTSIPSSQVPVGSTVTCDCASDPEEACCLPDGSCTVIPVINCLNLQGSPQGPGAVCGGALEACCVADADGNVNCFDADPLCCVNEFNGTPGGPGTACDDSIGSCCYDADGDGIDESCGEMNQTCCEALNGTFTGGGNCLGDANNNGIDDACELPDFCPLPTFPLVPICEQNLSQCQDGDATQRCLPRLLISTGDGTVFPELCECFDDGGACGPITVRDIPGTPFLDLSCEDQCPPGQNCVIHVDGNSTNFPSIPSNQVPAGSTVTCDCAPEPDEACCLPDGSCAQLTLAECVAIGGSPQGPGTVCAPAKESCCIADPIGGFVCIDADPLCCINEFGGVPGGAGSACGNIDGSCCYDADGDGIDESCGVMDEACCELLNGTWEAGGICLGDGNGNGIDDKCEDSDFCPLPNFPIVPICQLNQQQCEGGLPSELCLPRLLIIDPAVGAFPELCECFGDQDECGAISVRQVGPNGVLELSCQGACPPGADCLIHLDGQSSGSSVITADVLPPGTAVTCDCANECPKADQPLPENKLGEFCTSDADCSNLSVCRLGRCYVPKNKYISVRPENLGSVVGLRVTMTQNNLFPALVGSQWWVQPHVATDPPEVFRLGCTKHYQDWSTEPAVLQIADIHITTDAEYAVQALHENCPQDDPNNFSAPLLLPTVRLWGDCCGSTVAGVVQPPDGFVNFTDIQAAILNFQNAIAAPNDSWVDIDPDFPNAIVNLADVFRFVQAFQGAPYPYPGPVPCP